jgi:glycosyltransferase involved in cell wall biosynthesis
LKAEANSVRARVSVITVCLNDPAGLRATLDSALAQDYADVELVVIDGGSAAATQAVLDAYRHRLACCVSEPDQGIYDAMNKGLHRATGEWAIMMNAGDVFCATDALRSNIDIIIASGAAWGGGSSLVKFADGSQRRYQADPSRGVFHQQSLFVRRSLHEKYGYFVVDRRSHAWDFFFFNLLQNEPFQATQLPVAVCDGAGVSSTVENYLQACALAFVFGHQGRVKTALKLLLYPAYRRLRRSLPPSR